MVVDGSKYHAIFENTSNSDYYWTSTTDSTDSTTVLVASFANGNFNTTYGFKGDSSNLGKTNKVRCVRTRREASFYQ